MTENTVRGVRPADAAELGAAHVAIWHATYAGLLPQHVLDAHSSDEASERWRRIAAAASDPQFSAITTLCAVHHASRAIVGFVSVGPPREPEPPVPAELWALNVLAEHHGTGVADQLLETAFGSADHPAYLWVVTGNARAEAFYRKRGFVADGVTRFDDAVQCQESRMVRR